ncbi:hypothetical protein ANN_16371 [Periplaneta americana]|uniref:Uncharacterized protein n=1 Tax=Periplaneta americana TaxID=6978 RepID=A0ABQ8SIW6_PERAM|nr:hypothetical protein ANN_16371 [Periplaneta americana]
MAGLCEGGNEPPVSLKASKIMSCAFVVFSHDNGFEFLEHPPYSTDLAPSDNHLFPALKIRISPMTNAVSVDYCWNRWEECVQM